MSSESESESEESLYECDVEEEAVSIQIENIVEEEAVETEENHNEQERNDEHEVEEIQVEKSQETNKKKRSWVWDHFTYDNTTKKAKCVHCKVLISCNKGCTSGMSCHINSKHKRIKEKGKKQLTIHETINPDNTKVAVSIIFIISLQWLLICTLIR